MTSLRATSPRVYIDTQPYVGRYPVFNSGVFYYAGSVVSKSFQVSPTDSDNVYYNFYVSKRDISPGGLEPDVSGDWTLWVSSDPSLQSFYSDSELYTYLDQLDSDYKSFFTNTDSELTILRNQIGAFLEIDSDIAQIKREIGVLADKNLIDSLVDSDATHNKAIAWDSDTQKFKFVTPVTSVNNTSPDANGNVTYQFTETKTGTGDDLPDSDQNGTIFVVVGDSDSDANGKTYAFTDTGWVRLVGYTDKENELLYVNTAGDTMTGPLYLSRNPQSDSEAATKAYVDGFNDSDKQDKIILVDTVAILGTLSYETDRIYYVRENSTLWIYTNGILKQFVIPGQRVFDPVLLEVTVTNKTATTFDLVVDTYRFSSFLPGTVSFTKNGSLTPFIINNNITGTYELDNTLSSALLNNAGNQQFIIRVTEAFNNSAVYRLTFTAHDGTVTTIKVGDRNAVSFSETNRTLNFGEY